MSQTSNSVSFVCSFCAEAPLDKLTPSLTLENKKQKHFKEFQNTTCVVFEERDIPGELGPVIIKAENQLDKNSESPITIEVNDDEPINPFSSEIMDELNFFEHKSELITYESEIIPDNENSFFGLEQPEQNPYVLLKRLTSEEIQSACVPNPSYRLIIFEQKDFVSNSKPPNLCGDVDSNISDLIKDQNSTQNQPSVTVTNISMGHDLQPECKLCSRQFHSDVQLKIHVGICALYHEDRNRFCVTCNRKFCDIHSLNVHRLRFHATENESHYGNILRQIESPSNCQS